MVSYYEPVVKDSVLKDLKDNLSCAEAARRNHICVATVYRWRNESKLDFGKAPKNRPRPEVRAEVLERLAKGEAAVALSAEFGISAVAIHTWNKKANQRLLAKARYVLEKLAKREDLPEDVPTKLTAVIAVLERFL